MIYRSNKYLQIKELSVVQNIFDLQIEGLSTDRSSICISKNYLQIKELSADWLSICSSKNYLLKWSKRYLQVEELSADQIIAWRWENYLRME